MQPTERIDLEQLKPTAHPFRAVFRRHKVTNAMLAKYLSRHSSYVANMLGGHFPMPAQTQEMLEILVRQLEETPAA